MGRYRKKPVVVEAVQWQGPRSDGPTPTPEGVFRDPETGAFYVVTMHEQRAYLARGDWVITEPDGEHHYPCRPDVFAATYEPAESE